MIRVYNDRFWGSFGFQTRHSMFSMERIGYCFTSFRSRL